MDGASPIFRGRIIRDTSELYLTRQIECEGLMACLNDSAVPPYNFPEDYADDPEYITAAASGNVVAFWLGKLLTNHNAQVGTEQQLQLGSVTVTDPNNYIRRSNAAFSTTWETISEKLFGSTLGGYFLIRYEAAGNYIDYVADLPLTNVQTVEFAENLLDVNTDVNGADIFTAVLPVGAEGLTIADLPDGAIDSDLVKSGLVVYSQRAETAQGGRITKIQVWDDVTLASNLRAKAATMAAGMTLPQAITCKACDTHGADNSIPAFRVGRYIRVTSTPHSISGLYPLLTLDFDILNPAEATIELNRTESTLSRRIAIAKPRDGKDGEPGAPGNNSATILLYQRAASTPSKPSGKLTYTFATGALSGTLGSWSRSVPASNGQPCYVIQAAAISTGATDTIASSEWSSPVIMVEDGNPGTPGAPGYNTAIVYLYKRSASAASIDWTNALTYNFANKALTSTPSGWSQTIPSGADPIYVTAATAYSNTTTDSIAYTEWSAPVVLAANGSDGDPGTPGSPGNNAATVFLYQRAASTPSTPFGTLTYTFATGALSGTLGNWSRSILASDGNPCYVIQATAISTGATDTIAASEWSSPVIMVEDGGDGVSVTSVVEEYATSTNDTDAPTSGWSTTVPPLASNEYLWRRDLVTYSDGTSVPTTAMCISKTTNEIIAPITETVTNMDTTIRRTSGAIVTEALKEYVSTSALDTYKSEVSSRFTQTATDFNFEFSKRDTSIKNVNDDLQAKYNERLKYIRFVDGDIILGEEGNQIILKIENDRMGFWQNGQEVAWFSNNEFHVTRAEFTASAQIGKFAFVPGAGGNLSFKKVGA